MVRDDGASDQRECMVGAGFMFACGSNHILYPLFPFYNSFCNCLCGSIFRVGHKEGISAFCGDGSWYGVHICDFGSLASVIGHVMHDAGHWWSVFLGVLMILMALQIWDVIHIIPHIHMDQNMSRKGYIGAFLIGMLNGVFASHCATPVMIALLAMVAKADGSMIWGIFLMALYAIGHSILLVAAGTSYSAVQAVIDNPKYASFSKALRILMGAVILLIGIFILFAED